MLQCRVPAPHGDYLKLILSIKTLDIIDIISRNSVKIRVEE